MIACDWQPTASRALEKCSRCGGLLHLGFVTGPRPVVQCPKGADTLVWDVVATGRLA